MNKAKNLRRVRMAKALRENILKRKSQQRSRNDETAHASEKPVKWAETAVEFSSCDDSFPECFAQEVSSDAQS